MYFKTISMTNLFVLLCLLLPSVLVAQETTEAKAVLAKLEDQLSRLQKQAGKSEEAGNNLVIRISQSTQRLKELQQKKIKSIEKSERLGQALERLRTHIASNGPVEIDGKEYSQKELKTNADKIAAKIKTDKTDRSVVEAEIVSVKDMVHKLNETAEKLSAAQDELNARIVAVEFRRLNLRANLELLESKKVLSDIQSEFVGAATHSTQEESWEQIFDGESLEGWTPKIRGYELGENFGETFRVENGLLKVGYDSYEGEFKQRFGHLYYKEKLSHYLLRIEYRFVGEQVSGGPGWAIRNSGVMLHCQDPATIGLDQDFPVSIEMQMLGGDGTNARPNANLCTPGTNVEMNGKLFTPHCINSTSETYHGEQWVTVEIEVRGDEVIRHKLDGAVVLEYQKPQYDPNDDNAKPLIVDGNLALKEGHISLQSESHPIEFRKVELKRLEN